MNVSSKILMFIIVVIALGISDAIFIALCMTNVSNKMRSFVGAGLFASLLLLWIIIFNKYVWNKGN